MICASISAVEAHLLSMLDNAPLVWGRSFLEVRDAHCSR
jgi:hypothetical protein